MSESDAAQTGGGLDALGVSRVQGRMARVDAMPAEIRTIVHEHGLTIVDAFLQCGVKNAKQMRHLITTIRGGSYEIGNRSGLGGKKA